MDGWRWREKKISFNSCVYDSKLNPQNNALLLFEFISRRDELWKGRWFKIFKKLGVDTTAAVGDEKAVLLPF